MALKYIRKAATGTGDGSSWTNAYTSFAAAQAGGWARGNTYYVAGGTYNETQMIYIHPSTSGTSKVIIKKSNFADNHSDGDWDPSYASDITYINNTGTIGDSFFDFDRGYVEMDGVTGSGTYGHGIVIYNPEHKEVMQWENQTTGSGYSLKHVELKGAGYTGTTDGYAGLLWRGGGKNVYVAYCWIHDTTTNGAILQNAVGTSYSDYGFLFEYNVVSETGGCEDADKHGQGLHLGLNSELAYCIVRNNVLRNCVGTAYISFLGRLGGDPQLPYHHDILIVNNLFYCTNLAVYNITSPGIIWSESECKSENIYILNNTIWGLGSVSVTNVKAQISIEDDVYAPVNVVAENNIWENCNFTAIHFGLTGESNNGYYNCTGTVPSGTTNQKGGAASSSTFVDGANADFRLKTGGWAVGQGKDESSLITTDFVGATRVTWDCGAYYYVSPDGVLRQGRPKGGGLLVSF